MEQTTYMTSVDIYMVWALMMGFCPSSTDDDDDHRVDDDVRLVVMCGVVRWRDRMFALRDTYINTPTHTHIHRDTCALITHARLNILSHSNRHATHMRESFCLSLISILSETRAVSTKLQKQQSNKPHFKSQPFALLLSTWWIWEVTQVADDTCSRCLMRQVCGVCVKEVDHGRKPQMNKRHAFSPAVTWDNRNRFPGTCGLVGGRRGLA